jgi:TorA maturation chaperone TorD
VNSTWRTDSPPACQDVRGYAAALHAAGRDFLEHQVLPWAPIYLLAVQRGARTLLYREGAEALLDLLLADRDARDEGAPT